MPEVVSFGTLVIPNKTGKSQLEYPIEKTSVLIGRDKACDIRIINQEVSRRHLELSVNEDGLVSVMSLGREPVLVNKEQVLSPRVLRAGDTIEVLLEGRTREFFFKAAPEVVVKEEKGLGKTSMGSPLVASSIANRRCAGGDEEEDAEEEVVEEEAVEEEAVEANGAHCVPTQSTKRDLHCGAVSAVVTQMVEEVLERVIKSVNAASCLLTPVNSSMKKKSVRFVAHTPEGEARDATMTIRCIPKHEDDRQAVLVEDNTLAISEWGFKTMKGEEEGGEDSENGHVEVEIDHGGQNADSEVAKSGKGVDEIAEMDVDLAKSVDRETKDAQQLTPASIGERVAIKDPFHKLSSPLMSNRLNFEALASGALSQGTPGIAPAPATTPVTAAKAFMVGQNKAEEVDFLALTRKLEEIAEAHDVQFELPKDFMRFTPVPSVTKSKRKSLGEALSSHSVGRTSKRLSICSSSKEGSIEYDLPKDFMRFTPMNLKSALKSIEQTMTAVGGIHESLDDGTEEIATLRSVGHAVHDLADALDKAASTKKSAPAKTPGVKISIVEKGSAFKTANPEVKVLFHTEQAPVGCEEQQQEGGTVAADEGAADSQPIEKSGADGEGDNACEIPKVPRENKKLTKGASGAGRPPHTAGDLVARFKTAVGQARAYKTQAIVLGKHLKRSSAKLSKVQATAKVLSIKYRAEKAKRLELQNMIKRLLEAGEAEVEGSDVDYEEKEVAESDFVPTEEVRRVVVIGADKSQTDTRIEMTGDVVVVRPCRAANTIPTPVTVKKTRRSSVAPMKSVIKSVKRVSVGGEQVRVLVDDVEVPQWIFEEEEQENPEEIAGFDGIQHDADEKDEQDALENLAEALKRPLPEGPTEEEEGGQAADMGHVKEGENDGGDACFVCGIGDDGDVLLLCDSCDNACHLSCCKPARKTVPKGDWFCAECKTRSKKRKANNADTKSKKENLATAGKAATKKPKAAVAADKPTSAPTRATRRSTRN